MPRATCSRAPGKLFIAGEYAVVEPANPAVLVAVDRYLTVRATSPGRAGGHDAPGSASAQGGQVFSSAYPAPRTWRRQESGTVTFTGGAADYLTAALEAIEELREHRGLAPRNYDLHVTSELTEDGRKLGLGSSGALTVAVIGAAAQLYGLDLSRQERFRLALCAIITISPRASGGDVAASTYGGWIRYTSPDRAAIAAARRARGLAAAIDDDALWQGCTVSPLPEPVLPLLVGWTGAPADTDALVAKAAGTAYPGFTADSAAAVADLIAGIGSPQGLLAAVRRARQVLTRLAAARGTVIETELLTALCDAAEQGGGAGKPSGAGGGDCGIAFAPAERRAEILEQWQTMGILPLGLAHHPAEGDPDVAAGRA